MTPIGSLAVLSPVPPYPPASGGTAHIARALRQLARYFDLSLYALATEPSAVGWGPLAAQYGEARAFAREPARGWSLDPPAARLDQSAALATHLRAAWRARPPDVVQLEFTSMAQYAPLARAAGALAVCTAHNVAFLAQIRRARRERQPALRARRWIGALSLWRYELRALAACDLVVTLGQADRAALRRWLPRLPVAYVPSGVDLDGWPVCFDPGAEDEVLFVGNYTHPPNVEGALWLAREVWPLVRRSRQDARLTLAGPAPPDAIARLAGPDVHVPGALDDLRPVYGRSSVAVAPVFWGSGVRIKLLEALASGLPVVTTRLAAEGVDLVPQQSALFAERPEAFAAAIVRLLGDRALRERIGAAGRLVIERDHDWVRLGRRLAGLYAGALAGRGGRP